jgi:broad specificity polyphosphatase/5'/3'-nucleotidase SurE
MYDTSPWPKSSASIMIKEGRSEDRAIVVGPIVVGENVGTVGVYVGTVGAAVGSVGAVVGAVGTLVGFWLFEV